MQDFVEAAFAVVDLPWEKYVKHDPAFERPNEPGLLVGSGEKIRRVLGWQARTPFADLVREMVEAELSALLLAGGGRRTSARLAGFRSLPSRL